MSNTFKFVKIEHKLDIPIFEFLTKEEIHPIDVDGWDKDNLPKIGDTIIYKKGFWFDAKGSII